MYLVICIDITIPFDTYIYSYTFKTIYSNKTFDYMSCKKPVLLAIDGVSRELLNNANCGIYVEPENINHIVEGIKLLMSKSQKQLNLLGQNGYVYATEHFDRKILAKKNIKEIMNIHE